MINLLALNLILSTFCILLQNNNSTGKIPFEIGEKVSYSVFYNWGMLWLSAANVDFKIESEKYENKDVLKFISTGTSLPSYDWFFPVRDTFISFTDAYNLKSYYFIQNTSEGSLRIKNQLIFDYNSNQIIANLFSSKKGKSKKIFDLKPKSHDLLNAVYYCRTFEYDTLKLNQTIPIKTVVDDSIYNLYVRYTGKEIITLKNGRQFKTVRLRAKLIDGTIFSGGEDLIVWISDDKARIPIKVVAKILVGEIKAFVNEIENLKYPLTSEITTKPNKN